jgi:hypothetical protein
MANKLHIFCGSEKDGRVGWGENRRKARSSVARSSLAR